MLGVDTKISNTGTMRTIDLIATRKTEEQENHTHTMQGTSLSPERNISQRVYNVCLLSAFK